MNQIIINNNIDLDEEQIIITHNINGSTYDMTINVIKDQRKLELNNFLKQQILAILKLLNKQQVIKCNINKIKGFTLNDKLDDSDGSVTYEIKHR